VLPRRLQGESLRMHRVSNYRPSIPRKASCNLSASLSLVSKWARQAFQLRRGSKLSCLVWGEAVSSSCAIPISFLLPQRLGILASAEGSTFIRSFSVMTAFLFVSSSPRGMSSRASCCLSSCSRQAQHSRKVGLYRDRDACQVACEPCLSALHLALSLY